MLRWGSGGSSGAVVVAVVAAVGNGGSSGAMVAAVVAAVGQWWQQWGNDGSSVGSSG